MFKKNKSITTLYPMLNETEKSLSLKEPQKALQAYALSFEAESVCSSLFLASKTNDESDACRHFFWAYLMAKNIDVSFAEKALSAHEEEPLQSSKDKEMDVHNNSISLEFFNKNKNCNEVCLKNEFLNKLKNKTLKVNTPDLKNWRQQ